MTYGEIVDTLKAHHKKYQVNLKEKALMDYKLADLIAVNVARLLDKDAVVPPLVEAYEFLFQEEKKELEEAKAQAETEIWKQRMKAFAESHNRKWGEKI